MDKIEKQDKDIITLRSKYERSKAIMASHGISFSEVLGCPFLDKEVVVGGCLGLVR